MSGTFAHPTVPFHLHSVDHHTSATPFVGVTNNGKLAAHTNDFLSKHSDWYKRVHHEHVLRHEAKAAKEEAKRKASLTPSEDSTVPSLEEERRESKST